MSTLNSRAALLLQKQLCILKKQNLWGVHVELVDDNIFIWKLVLSGLKDTIWEDSQIGVVLEFSQHFNLDPPHVFFKTLLFHPNVDDEDGSVSLDCLNEWNEKNSIYYIILSIQLMLSEPSLSTPLNGDAARLLTVSPNHYKQLALNSVLANHRSFSSLPPLSRNEHSDTILIPENKKNVRTCNPKSCYKVSFENYLHDWKSLGTSLSDTIVKKDDPCSYPAIVQNEEIVNRNASEFKEETEVIKKHSKLEHLKATRLQLMKDIHSNKRGGMDTRTVLPESSDEIIHVDTDIDSAEVNSLLSWSENLPQ